MADSQNGLKRRVMRAWLGFWVPVKLFFRKADAAQLLLGGYLFYMLAGWGLLSLPIAQATPVSSLDNLFIASSAVSTTGLVTVDPGSSYTLFGEIVILLLIQLGGIGYMTFGSFLVLSLSHRWTRFRETVTRAAFPLPSDFDAAAFIRRVVYFTLAVEAIGALLLWPMLAGAGVDNALWSAIFHSVSAFCTAGFSLFPNSFEDFTGHAGIVLTLSGLSYLGAIGFIVMTTIFERLTRKRDSLGFTSTVILSVTVKFAIGGTAILFIVEPSIAGLEPAERLLAAFFQVMTASTTVGFNTVPIGNLSMAILMVMFLLMVFGASPSGTGGGLKSTTFAALVGLMRSVFKRRDTITYMGRELSEDRVHQASVSFGFYFLVLATALFALFLTELDAPFEQVVFEAISALGTVGLSMGLTGDLSTLGKLIVIVLMLIGRVGILTFGLAIVARDRNAPDRRDDELVM
ncbi:MAG: TrkH family potassium uptake protein [Caulobacterales bacterium]|uniref:TrkH family potassium uptake protein n=1 Tax=Glycocaulis sp. TaxID=1969725 RepID=UPI003FA01A30